MGFRAGVKGNGWHTGRKLPGIYWKEQGRPVVPQVAGNEMMEEGGAKERYLFALWKAEGTV